MNVKEKQIFNLMDTNGRRNDVVNALQGYLTILDDVLRNQKLTWKALPDSTAEYDFYRQAIALSPDVFKKHDKFDILMEQLESLSRLKKAIEECDTDWLNDNYSLYPDWFSELDKSVEARARHYTSNLVKLGFADNARNITSVGDVLLDNISLRKDVLESLLPLNSTNIVYLRQLLKLRIFDNKGQRYYSPFCMALYMLLTKERVSQEEFCEIVQGLSPYHDITDYDGFINEYKAGDVIQNDTVTLPGEIDANLMIKREVFENIAAVTKGFIQHRFICFVNRQHTMKIISTMAVYKCVQRLIKLIISHNRRFALLVFEVLFKNFSFYHQISVNLARQSNSIVLNNISGFIFIYKSVIIRNAMIWT